MTIKELKQFDIQNYDIRYYDENHSYYHTVLEKKLPSVTQLKSQYKKPFDTHFFASKAAEKNGITKEEQLTLWNDLKEIGCQTGTLVHNYLEQAIKNKIYPLRDDKNSKWSNSINSRLSLLKSHLQAFLEDFKFNVINIPIAQECVIGNELFAGQLDYFGYNTDTNRFTIYDWKSDAEFTETSKYKYINNLKHLQDSKRIGYSLQLSLYQYCILETLGLTEEDIDRCVIWFNENNDSYKVIPVNFMKNEVDIIVEDLKILNAVTI